MITVLKAGVLILLLMYGMLSGAGAPNTEEPMIIETESGDAAMWEELMKLEGMTEARAQSIAASLKDAGILDAAEFALAPKGTGYALTFFSGGKQYTAELTRGLLFRRLRDENGKTVYGVVM